ncbi:MAG TPA: IPT/TIG domain-containing protein [Solirubrobacteraceae bacterium]|nr:IPT/TIG domain-containing protein [Solirubrobacteraceae bacterium]
MDRSIGTARTGSRRTRGARSRQSLLAALALALLVSGALLLHAATVHAGAASRALPLIQHGKLIAGDAEATANAEEKASGAEARFGSSAALSSDGGTLLIGAPHDDSARGAAWVFTRVGDEWVRQGGKLTAGELPGAVGEECTGGSGGCEECAEEPPATSEEEGECAFGTSVAISADGNTAIVGNPTTTNSPGAAWVFTREGSTWTRAAALTGGNTIGEGRFGKSVALSADGETALVGDPSSSNGRGSAWLFAREGSSWTRLGAISDAEASTFAHFGRSVALSGDGSLALVGGPGDAEYAGAAWTFARSGSGWTQQARKVTEQGAEAGDHFGRSVALSADGSTALIGAREAAAGRGSASLFATSPEGLVQQGERLVGAEGEQHFGASVALSGDGGFALVGAPRATANGGTVTELIRSGSTWEKEVELISAAGAKNRSMFGAAVALSSDGEVAAVGSPRDSNRLGAAWVFAEGTPPPPIIENVVPGRGPSAGGTPVAIRGENLERPEQVTFGGVQAASIVRISATEITAVTPPGTPGRVAVSVSTSGGVNLASSQATFFYESADPPGEAGGGGGGASSSDGGTKTGTTAAGGVAGFTSAAGAACTVSLRKARLAVTRYRTVALRLTRTGAGACRGKLALSYRVKAKGRHGYALRTVGTASFSIAAGTSRVFKVTLTKAGRKWFRSHHGKANASLAIARVVPAPMTARSASVRLSIKKTLQR